MELVATTDPSERFRILKERIDDAGVSFDSMDYYQRKALASAMGLNEQQLALLTRGSLDQIMPKPKSAEDIEALAKQTAQFNTLAEEMIQIGRAFAISFGPLISGIKTVVQAMQPFIPYIIGAATALLVFNPAVTGIAAVIAVLTGGLILLTTAWSDFTHGMQFGFSMTPTAALEMTGNAISNITSLIEPLTAIMNPMHGMFADMSHGAEDLADSMSLIPSEKSASFVSTVKQTADAAETVNQTAFASTAATIGAQAAAPAPAATQASGPPPVININLSIDGTEFAAVVNSVAVESYSGGKPSDLHNSIAHMIEQGLMTGRRGI